MNIETFLNDWIDISNSFDTEKYLLQYHEYAILDDPSVGRKFEGRDGIRDYFESYFIGYNTHTTKKKLATHGANQAHLEVEFTGTFPEGKIGGTFDFTFRDNKIATVKADLI